MLVANQQEINLGNVQLNKSHNFKFVLKNTSDKEIKINKIVVGCNSCTIASMNSNTVAPGQSADLNVVFTPNSTGLNSKSITVFHTVNGSPVNYSLKFKAQVDG